LSLYDDELGTDLIHNIFITEKGEQVMETTNHFYEEIKKTELTDVIPTTFETQFNEFWETFPSSDKYMGYPRTRVLRTDKEHCRKYYKKALEEISHSEIIEALMKASSAWLNQKEYNIYSQLMKEDKIEKKDAFSEDV